MSSFEVESFNRRVMAVSDKSTVLNVAFSLGQVYTIGVQVKLSQESFDFHTFNHSPGVNLYVPEVDRLYQYFASAKEEGHEPVPSSSVNSTRYRREDLRPRHP